MTRNTTLLGFPSITENGQPSDITRNHKGMALLTYLLVRRSPATREHIADLLWDSADTSASLRNLRVLLTRIRPHIPNLIITRASVQYDPAPGEDIDYLSLTDKLSARNTEISLDDLRLYRGELLEGLYLEDAPRFMEWLTIQREKLRRSVLDAHHALCQSLADQHRWQEGGETAAHWLSIDPLDEEAIRWQMQFMGASGQASAALKAYEAYKNTLRDHLGHEPEEITQTLALELQASLGSFESITNEESVTLAGLTAKVLPSPGSVPVHTILSLHRNDGFLGREETLLQLASILGQASKNGRAPAAAITGIGGMGKTQTAVEFCYRYGRFFPGGVFWLNFEDEDNVADEVAMIGSERGLGLFRETDELTLADQVGRVRKALQESTPRLLIFDNCESENIFNQWRPVSGGCRVLITSRQNVKDWTSDVTAVPLNGLDQSESILLLKYLAHHVTDSEAEEIAREVGYLPLALHLAGSFLNKYQQITPTDYVQQLREMGALKHPSLQGHGSKNLPTEHDPNVARTFEINWKQLDTNDTVDATARRLIAHAACLAPAEPIPANWLKLTIKEEGSENVFATLLAEDALSRLNMLGLLKKEEQQTLFLHPLLALFVKEIVGQDGMETALRFVASNMADTLSEYRQTEGNLSVMPIPAAHVRYVCDEVSHNCTPVTARLLIQWGYHLDDIGNSIDAESVLKHACQIASESGDPILHAQALTALSNTQESLGHDDESFESVNQAVHLFKQAPLSKPDGLAEALYYLGWMYYRLGRANEALEVANEAHELVRSIDLPLALGSVLNLIGVVEYYMLGNYASAQEHLEEALNVYQEAGNHFGKCFVLNNMGENARLQGKYQPAVQYYEEALVIARQFEAHNKADVFLSNLCGARIHSGQVETAIKDLEGLISRKRYDWYGLSEAYRFLAEAYLVKGSPSRSLTMAQQALALASKSNSFDIGRAWRVLGLISMHTGKPVPYNTQDNAYNASTCFQYSLENFNEKNSDRDRTITLWHWAQYELTKGNKKNGKEMQQEAEDILQQLNLPLVIDHLKSR